MDTEDWRTERKREAHSEWTGQVSGGLQGPGCPECEGGTVTSAHTVLPLSTLPTSRTILGTSFTTMLRNKLVKGADVLEEKHYTCVFGRLCGC